MCAHVCRTRSSNNSTSVYMCAHACTCVYTCVHVCTCVHMSARTTALVAPVSISRFRLACNALCRIVGPLRKQRPTKSLWFLGATEKKTSPALQLHKRTQGSAHPPATISPVLHKATIPPWIKTAGHTGWRTKPARRQTSPSRHPPTTRDRARIRP